MKKFTKIKLYISSIFVISFILILSISLIQATNITTCQTLSSAGATYTLQNDITGIAGTCFTITADNIILDGNGYIIDGDDSGTDYGVYASGRDNLTIKNFRNITDFYYGIYFFSTSNSLITNNTIDSNAVAGIYFVSSSNNNQITNNTVNSHVYYGISLHASPNNIVTSNILNSNNYGIRLASTSGNNQLLNNQITGSSTQDIYDLTGNSYTNYLIYNNSFGEIRWTDITSGGFLKDLDLTGNIGLGVNLSIGNNTAYLNAGVFTSSLINSSANITLYGIDDFGFIDNLQILRNGVDCGNDCVNFTPLNAATVKFNVTYAGANYGINGTVGAETTPLENATFENVNVTNNLDVGQDVSALRGFFDYLGSSVSRITKLFTEEIDISKNAIIEALIIKRHDAFGPAILLNNTADAIRIFAAQNITNPSFGAGLQLFGNNEGYFPGDVFIDAGSTSGADITLRTGANGLNNRVIVEDDGEVVISDLAGTGNGFVCVDANGKIFRSSSQCV